MPRTRADPTQCEWAEVCRVAVLSFADRVRCSPGRPGAVPAPVCCSNDPLNQGFASDSRDWRAIRAYSFGLLRWAAMIWAFPAYSSHLGAS